MICFFNGHIEIPMRELTRSCVLDAPDNENKLILAELQHAIKGLDSLLCNHAHRRCQISDFLTPLHTSRRQLDLATHYNSLWRIQLKQSTLGLDLKQPWLGKVTAPLARMFYDHLNARPSYLQAQKQKLWENCPFRMPGGTSCHYWQLITIGNANLYSLIHEECLYSHLSQQLKMTNIMSKV